MEIEQKERERIEKSAYRHRRIIQDKEAERIGGMNECIMLDAMKHESTFKVGAFAEHLHLQKEVIQPKDKRISELEAENKALRDGIVEFLTWMKKTQRLSIEAITAIDQLILKNEG